METVSVIVPVMDEQETVATLAGRVQQVFATSLAGVAELREIIFVDDGSRDATWERVRAIAGGPVRGLRLRRNFGKAAALQAGILASSGSILITMDGDLQDDPDEIPRFLEQVRAGFDVVSGWKRTRHDPLGKTLPSKLFNLVTARVSGVDIHDFNCGFKAYRREVFDNVDLYGELHRFIPALAAANGFGVTEIEVLHHPRRFGRSKYGVGRLIKGFIDLLTVVTITKYNSRPGHLFGTLGIGIAGLGLLVNLYLAVLWLMGHAIGQRPLLSLGVLLSIVGLQFILFGMLSELIVSRGGNRQSARSIVAEHVGGERVAPDATDAARAPSIPA